MSGHGLIFNFKDNYISISNGKNTGACYAEGELLVFIDDTSRFNCDFLQLYWDWYQKGYFAQAFYTYYLWGVPHPKFFSIKTDNRYVEEIEKEGLLIHNHGSWFHGYSSVSLNAFLEVNGFDELYDGCKSLEDADLGLRLESKGYKFVLDKNLYIEEGGHWNIEYNPPKPEFKINPPLVDLWASGQKPWKANYCALRPEDIEFIKKTSLEKYGFKVDENNLDWQIWTNNCPIFNLAEMRKEYLKSKYTKLEIGK